MINLTAIDWKAIDLTNVNVISNWLMANPIIIVIIFSIILLLKGLALYRAARKESMVWFWVLLIFNTLGILPLLYLIFSRRE